MSHAISQPDHTPAVEVSLDAPSKRITRIFLKFSLISATLGLITSLSLGVLIAVNLQDESPFEDADLRAIGEPISEDQNSAPGIRRAMQTLDGKYFWETKNSEEIPLATVLATHRIGSFARGGPPGEFGSEANWESSPVRGMVENAFAEHAEFYALIDAACALPECRFPEPTHALEGIDEWYSRSREAWQLVQLRSDIAFARGDRDATIAADFSQIRYATRCHEGSHTIVQKIPTLAQLRFALLTIARHIEAGVFEGREAELTATLRSIGIDRTSASDAVRTEYRLFRSLVFDTPDLIGDEEISSRGVSFLFHPYETLRALGEYYRAAMLEGESTGRVVETPPPTIETGWAMKLLKGNGLGHSLLEMAQLELDSIYARTNEVIREIEVLEKMVAAP